MWPRFTKEQINRKARVVELAGKGPALRRYPNPTKSGMGRRPSCKFHSTGAGYHGRFDSTFNSAAVLPQINELR